VYGLVRRLLNGQPDTDDVHQEAWLRAIRALPGFRWESTLGSWLCGIAVNCCRERWRRDAAREEETLREIAASPHEDGLDVDRALARLPPGYRAVLILHDVLGCTHEEIARRLDIEPGTSKSQLARGREALRMLLGDGRSRK
jgi:RNA polymerase sigma-70 factor (ECF subfamily)